MWSNVVLAENSFSARPLAIVKILLKTSLLNENKWLIIALEESKKWARKPFLANGEWQVYGWLQGKKFLDWDEIRYSEVFEVADYESEFNVQTFRMAGPGWFTKKLKVMPQGFLAAYIFWMIGLSSKSVYGGFWVADLIVIRKFKIKQFKK